MTLNPGTAQTVNFTVSAHDLAHWDDTANAWSTTAGTYQILVGDSSRNLPLSGNLTVGSTISSGAGRGRTAASGGTGALAVPNPHGMSSRLRASVTWQFAPADARPHLHRDRAAGRAVDERATGRLRGGHRDRYHDGDGHRDQGRYGRQRLRHLRLDRDLTRPASAGWRTLLAPLRSYAATG